ncbi:MAG: ATP-binding cassette domain-containing protein, partial [Planctomycetota bacterium]
EVGTGFHPELSGRENIFLNGSILGMSRREIKSKFDEITAFADLDKFLDTPVKRYSSGMFVRLAFAVAAHLQPEVLIVDEVLAVGDAQFQKKCLGRMKDISRQNRTVLFVSHNTHAVLGLCDTVVWLESGRIKLQGGPREIVSTYLSDRSSEEWSKTWEGDAKAPGNAKVTLRNVLLEPDFREGEGKISLETSLQFTFDVINHVPGAQLHLSVHLVEVEKGCILCTTSAPRCHEAGVIRSGFRLPGGLVNDGTFFLRVIVVEDGVNPILVVNEALFFTIHDTERTSGWYGKWEGAVRPRLNWTVENAQAI